MKKVGIWILNNLKWLLAIVVFGVTAAVISSSILGSLNDYKDYEIAYDINDLELRSNAPATPKRIEIQDDYVTYAANGSISSAKSKYTNQLNLGVDDLKITSSKTDAIVDGSYIDLGDKGGTISFKGTLEEKSFVDVVFVVSSTMETTENEETVYGVKDLLSNVKFTVNGEDMDDVIDLTNSGSDVEWHELVMAGFALPAGNVEITIKSNSGKNAYMPQLRNISLFSSVEIGTVEENA